MSLKGKYTTTYDVIERVRREGVSDFTEEEAKEWIWEVVSYLGVPSHYVDKVAVLKIENARSMLPYDLYDISEGGIREYTNKVVLLQEKNIYYNPDTVGEIEGSTSNVINLTWEAPSVVYIDGVQQEDTEAFLAQIPNYSYVDEKYTYKINDGFLYTGFKDGYVEIAYKAFPVDNNNAPMIHDDAKVIRAVVNYIIKKVAKRMWLRDEISDRKLQKLEQEYSYAAAAARNNAMIGSIDDWETIRARTQRLYRDPNMQKMGFDGMSYREQLNLNGHDGK